jgi:hypothetical protein
VFLDAKACHGYADIRDATRAVPKEESAEDPWVSVLDNACVDCSHCCHDSVAPEGLIVGGLRRLRVWLIPFLLAVLLLLILAKAMQAGWLTPSSLAQNKDAIGSGASIIAALAVAISGALAYFRFFSGRTFTTRANVSIAVEVIAGPNRVLTHSLSLKVENVGTTALNDVSVEVTAQPRGASKRLDSHQILRVGPSSSYAGPAETIDPGEIAGYFSQQDFLPDIWMVTYHAKVRVGGNVWTESLAVANREATGG